MALKRAWTARLSVGWLINEQRPKFLTFCATNYYNSENAKITEIHPYLAVLWAKTCPKKMLILVFFAILPSDDAQMGLYSPSQVEIFWKHVHRHVSGLLRYILDPFRADPGWSGDQIGQYRHTNFWYWVIPQKNICPQILQCKDFTANILNAKLFACKHFECKHFGCTYFLNASHFECITILNAYNFECVSFWM